MTQKKARHNTIIDLLRNDLSMVADDVQIRRYKFLQKIKTHNDELWQMNTKYGGPYKNI